MRILTKEDIQKVYTMEDAIAGDKEALALAAEGKSEVPLRTNIEIEEHNGQSLYMPAYVQGADPALGVKIISIYPDNLEKDLPTSPSTMVMVNVETGMVEAVINGTYLTQLRTGAVQGAATDLLARKDAKIAALIGTGGQAVTQLEAMLTVRDLEEVRVMDLDKERAEAFAQEMTEKFKDFNTKLIAVDKADEAIADADIITPLKEKLISEEDFDGTLGELVLGKIKGRESEEEITVFKTVGTAVLDIVTGEKILKKAQAADVGQEIDL